MPGPRRAHCECDWTFHRGQSCRNEPADHGSTINGLSISTSPQLCTPCLFVYCAERDDVEDPREDVDA